VFSEAGHPNTTVFSLINHLLVILNLGVLTTCRYVSAVKEFKVTRLNNGTAVCAIDEPTVVIAFDQLSVLSDDSNA